LGVAAVEVAVVGLAGGFDSAGFLGADTQAASDSATIATRIGFIQEVLRRKLPDNVRGDRAILLRFQPYNPLERFRTREVSHRERAIRMSTPLPVPKRTLGRTGIPITPIGLGLMEFSGGGGWLGRLFPVIPQEDRDHSRRNQGQPG
jgi:hypothetical protein